MTKEEVIEILERFVLGAKSCSQREIVDACASAYGMLKEQSLLPSNLDEAVEEEYPDFSNDFASKAAIEAIRGAFKTGVEWLAGQGVTKEAVIGMATSKIIISVSQQTLDELDLCPGDKVIFQIRKK